MPERPVTIVVAVARNGVIGRDGGLPWRIRSDLKHFKALTKGAALIMGRRTFESLAGEGAPGGLPGRLNIIVSRSAAPEVGGGGGVTSATGGTGVSPVQMPRVLHARSLSEALELARREPPPVAGTPIVIAGGGEIYRQALAQDLVDRMEITDVQAEPEGDTSFPTAANETGADDSGGDGLVPKRSRFWSHDPAERAALGWQLIAERFTPADAAASDEFACWFRTYERRRIGLPAE